MQAMMDDLRLDPGAMAELVDTFHRTADVRPWNRFTAFQWEAIDADRLTAEQRSALAFVTFIEDHLPGYFAEYSRLFPVNQDTSLDEFVHNREVYRFTVKWAQEEDRHAHVLFMYQVRAGLTSAERLRAQLADEGRKRFLLPYREPAQLFLYALVQEKATQLYYQQFAGVVEEPVLHRILVHLVRDESRHFAFFASVAGAYVERFGDRFLTLAKDVVEGFKMPLAGTMRNYWRWALQVADAVGGYDHTAAYEELVRMVRRFADAPTTSKSHELVDLVRAIRTL
jgi:acyl-[acyl-carrier-protein] desaturase